MNAFLDGGSPILYYCTHEGLIMKRSLTGAAIFALLLSSVPLRALSLEDLNAVLDFTVTIKSLNKALEAGNYDAPRKFFALTGSYIDLLQADKESGTVIIELATGEWEGLEEVRSYRCLIRFQGPDYPTLFPARTPRRPDPALVLKHSRLLVIAFPVGVVELPGGRELWLLDGVYYRRL